MTSAGPDFSPAAPRWLRYLWASPNTALGLGLAGLAVVTGGSCRVVGGVLEAQGGLIRTLLTRGVPLAGGASAMTLGHVVVGCNAPDLERTRTHERAHVRQSERWGPLFLPAYAAASALAALSGGHYYRDNCFERDARREELSTAAD